MDDFDSWQMLAPEDMWVYDKLILSRHFGYRCGPAGVAPDATGEYVVRPISNYRMMGAGAKIMHIEAGQDIIPDGFFWCEKFEGRHLSFDYFMGEQRLAVEGIRHPERLDRFWSWHKVNDIFPIPECLQPIAKTYWWVNIETIGDKVIEVHLRHNDDFEGHDSDVIFPVWKEDFVESRCGDRVGFILGDENGLPRV